MKKFAIHPSIKEAIRHNSLILFIGSGYSRNIGLPNWRELAEETVNKIAQNDPSLETLKTELSKNEMKPSDIFDTLYKKGLDSDVRKILQDIIDIDLSKQDLENQKRIWRISEKIITTNYDKALESALDEDLLVKVDVVLPDERYKNISFLRDISYLYKIHGSIDRLETCILFSTDYEQLYKHNTAFISQIKRLCVNSVILFVGYSIEDEDIQRVLKNISSLFHIGTKHFVVTTTVKEFEKYGVDTVKIEDYAELPAYLAELVSYRQEIVRQFSAIEESVKAQYAVTNDLLSSFDKEIKLFTEQEDFKRHEDRQDILQLEVLDALDPVANQSIINNLKAEGKEEDLKDYLLLRREASRLHTLAYFEHLESGRDQTNYEAWVKTNLEAMKIAHHVFGDMNRETLNLYNDIGQGYFHLNDLKNAERYFDEGLQLALKFGEDKYLTAAFYNNLANIENERNNPEKAMNLYHLASQIDRKMEMETDGEKLNIATTLMKQKEYERAKKIYEQVLQGTKAPDRLKAEIIKALGLAHVRLNEYSDAIKRYEEAQLLLREYYGEANEEVISFYNEIGYCYTQEKQYEKAVDNFKKAVELDQNTERVFMAMNNMGEAYFNAERFEEALAVFEQSLVFLKEKGPSESEYPDGYEYCNKQLNLCREKMK